MTARTPPTTVRKLAMAEQFKLIQYVQAEYVSSCLNDDEFAKQASDKLGFYLTGHNVAGARKAFDIESTLDRLARERKEARAAKVEPQTRLELIEGRLLEVETQLNNLLNQLGVK